MQISHTDATTKLDRIGRQHARIRQLLHGGKIIRRRQRG